MRPVTSGEDHFRNVYYIPGEEPVFCYRSGLTVYEEIFSHGRLTVSGWNAAGYPMNVLGSNVTRMPQNACADAESFMLDVNGCACNQEMTFVSFDSSDEDGRIHAVLRLKNERNGIEVAVHTLIDGTPCFERYVEIVNLGDSPAAVSRLAPLSGAVEQTDLGRFAPGTPVDGIYELGYFDSDSGNTEGDFSWHKLRPDRTSFGGRYSRGRCRAPVFYLKNRLRGTVMTAQLAYSGGYLFSFDYKAHPWSRQTTLSFSADIDSFRPLCVIGPGETLKSPAVHIGMVQGDLDDAVNAMFAHLRSSVLTLPEAAPECVVGAGMGPEHDMLLDTTKQFIDQMAAAGAEVFIIDAGWYVSPSEGTAGKLWWSCAGDWNYAPDRYPNGIREVLDYARSKGLKLGMWMEVERIGSRSKLYEDFRDRFTVHRDGERSNGYLDLSDPENVAWCEEQAARIITDYGLSLFRIDYNVGGDEYFFARENGRFRECGAMRQVEGFYRLYGNLKKRFPNVIFENCAGGGGRCDPGMMRFFNHTWVSDNQIPPRSLLITNGMTMLLPPERVDRLVAGMGCHTVGSLAFHMRNAMLTHMTLNCFGQKDCEMNSDIFGFVRRSTDLYKSFIAPMLPGCLVFHHTPDTNEALGKGLAVIEDASPDGSKGVIGVFTLPGFDGDRPTVFPKGISAGKRYEVTFDNTGETVTLSGYEMSRDGIRAALSASLDSELILYREI